jgi:hypothetical protein
MLDGSDIISFHDYSRPDDMREPVKTFAVTGGRSRAPWSLLSPPRQVLASSQYSPNRGLLRVSPYSVSRKHGIAARANGRA